jgi:hypothetical protein
MHTKFFAAALTVALGICGFATRAHAEGFKVHGDVGNSTMTAVFDAPLGERINAVSNEVDCDLTWDDKTGMSGTCEVPIMGIRVDNDDTKSDHFRQWATNKKMDPKDCKLTAKFSNVKPKSPLVAEQKISFEAEVPFTVCGRARDDGKPEHVSGVALLLPAGTYGDAKTIRIDAHVENFNRESYHVGPKWTDGWFARVQGLAKVVAPTGNVDMRLFAVSTAKGK